MKCISVLLALTLTAMYSCNNPAEQGSGVDSMPLAPDTSVSPMKINPDTSLPLPTADNSMTSLDWNGTYKGVVPCADCEGIETTLTINLDKIYTLTTKYLGKKDAKPIVKTGTFEWNSAGSNIKLNGIQNAPSQYKVGENRLFQLDMKGEMIKTELAPKYILEKQPAQAAVSDAPITDTYWKLTELLGKPVDTTVKRKEMFLQFEKESGRVTGSGGCNSVSGTYTTEANGRITLSKMISTRMACPAMQDESAFLQALSKVNTYIVSGNKLQLTTGKMAPLLVFESAAKPQ
ncbi:MAG TPA: META domain-containing protein [Chitinophagaceae bacterium]|nr:META domain-containing protein [Chitinophagaceae bacterium]